MKITSMTVLIAAVSCLQIARIISRVKQGTIDIRSAGIWFCIWIIIGVSSMFPSLLDYFMQIAQMGDRMFFILVLAIFVLFALLFDLSTKYEKLQKDKTKLIQETAILKYRLDNGLPPIDRPPEE